MGEHLIMHPSKGALRKRKGQLLNYLSTDGASMPGSEPPRARALLQEDGHALAAVPQHGAVLLHAEARLRPNVSQVSAVD